MHRWVVALLLAMPAAGVVADGGAAAAAAGCVHVTARGKSACVARITSEVAGLDRAAAQLTVPPLPAGAAALGSLDVSGAAGKPFDAPLAALQNSALAKLPSQRPASRGRRSGGGSLPVIYSQDRDVALPNGGTGHVSGSFQAGDVGDSLVLDGKTDATGQQTVQGTGGTANVSLEFGSQERLSSERCPDAQGLVHGSLELQRPLKLGVDATLASGERAAVQATVNFRAVGHFTAHVGDDARLKDFDLQLELQTLRVAGVSMNGGRFESTEPPRLLTGHLQREGIRPDGLQTDWPADRFPVEGPVGLTDADVQWIGTAAVIAWAEAVDHARGILRRVEEGWRYGGCVKLAIDAPSTKVHVGQHVPLHVTARLRGAGVDVPLHAESVDYGFTVTPPEQRTGRDGSAHATLVAPHHRWPPSATVRVCFQTTSRRGADQQCKEFGGTPGWRFAAIEIRSDYHVVSLPDNDGIGRPQYDVDERETIDQHPATSKDLPTPGGGHLVAASFQRTFAFTGWAYQQPDRIDCTNNEVEPLGITAALLPKGSSMVVQLQVAPAGISCFEAGKQPDVAAPFPVDLVQATYPLSRFSGERVTLPVHFAQQGATAELIGGGRDGTYVASIDGTVTLEHAAS